MFEASYGKHGMANLVVENHQTFTLVDVRAAIDIASAPGLDGVLDPQRRRHASLLVDLSRCPYIDSNGLSLLVRHHRTARPLVVIVPANHRIHDIFDKTALTGFLHVAPSRKEALAMLESICRRRRPNVEFTSGFLP